MNKVIRWVWQVAVGALFFAGIASFGVLGSTAQAAWEGNPGSGVLSGRITSVDLQQSLLTVKTGLFAKKSFIIEETSKISNGVNEMKLEDLKPGDVVNFSFDSTDGKQVVRSLIVGSASPAEGESTAQPISQPPTEQEQEKEIE